MAHQAESQIRENTNGAEESIMSNREEKWEEEVLTVLDVPVILREVLKRLDGNDLVRCSEVNKLWRREALTVMRDWKRFLAPVELTNKVRRSKIACKDLKDLNDIVASMSIVPFRGLAMVFVEDNHGPAICPAVTNVGEYYCEILSRIPMNSVQIGWLEVEDRSEEDRRNFLCPAIQLLLKIMKEHCHKIMGLTIDALPPSVQLYTKEDLQSGAFSLPELQELLLFRHCESDDEYPPTLLEDLMSVAPKLGYLEASLSAKQFKKFPSGKYSILGRFTLEMFKKKFEDAYYNFALEQPKLNRLSILHTYRIGQINFQKWMETLKLIFQSSSSCLQELLIDSYTLSLLIKYQLCMQPLEELETLEIATGIDPAWVSPTMKILSKLNFRRMFPKVKKVTVFPTYPDPVLPPEIVPFDNEDELVEADDASLSTEYIKELVITKPRPRRRFRHHSVLRDPVFLGTAYNYWSQIFPHITSLTARVPFRCMWSNWQNLEELHLNTRMAATRRGAARNCDVIFCGIHRKEVELLQEESEDFLRRVNLVTWPSIAHLGNLKKLHVTVERVSRARRRTQSTPKLWLWSRLTPLLTFARMKNLKDVTVVTADKKLFKHLFSHVTVTSPIPYSAHLNPDVEED